MDVNPQAVTHVTFITQERVCLSWRVSPEPPRAVNSLSSMSVTVQSYLGVLDMPGGCHVILLN